MDERKIPSFLLTNTQQSADDRKRLIADLQRLCLWRFANGSKPYDHEAAIQLQTKLRAQRQVRLLNEAKRETKRVEEAEKRRLELCREIAKICFAVIVEGSEDQVRPIGKINFNEKIRSKSTGAVLGTPFSLFESVGVTQWGVSGISDPRENLTKYLDKLRSYYHDFQQDFVSDCHPEEISISEYPDKYVRFRLRLQWKLFSKHEIEKKIRKLLAKSMHACENKLKR